METDNVKRLNTGIVPVVLLLALLGLSLKLLNSATQDPESFGELYPTLLAVSGAELIVLLILIAANVARLVRQYRNRATGSRLSVRLIVMFVILAVTPVSIVYYFSLEFLRRGIDSWFDVRVESALEGALSLSRAALDERVREQHKVTERMATALTSVLDSEAPFTLNDLRQNSKATELTLLTTSGRIIASSSVTPTAIIPNQPHEIILLQVRQGHDYVGIDPVRDGGLHVRVVVPVPHVDATAEPRVLQSLVPVAKRINDLAEAVQSGYEEYEEMAYMREPLKFSFMLTLSLVLLLSLFTAVWGAFYSARRLVAPIRVLAIGTRLVSSGDYGKQLPLPSNDELGVLVQSFNDMTRKIAQARDDAERSKQRAEGQKAYLEAVLGRLSSGVLVLNHQHALRTINAAASQIFGINLNEYIGKSIEEVGKNSLLLNHFVEAIIPPLRDNVQEWREEFTFFGATGRQVLLCRGASLVGEADVLSHVIVFDDITALVQAQRDAAWGEVARRLAHEIKNPLTPIQLSAERLRHKYLKTMEPADAKVLDRATHTIVQQVETMKEMVKAFSDYARSPKLNLQELDLNAIIDEVLELYRAESIEPQVAVALAEELPLIEADSGRMRQLLHNLIKNGIEAVDEVADGRITITTQLLEQTGFEMVELSVEDNGPGISEELMGQLFEPYVTSKPKGSGLGLAIVKKIVEEHGGVLLAENREQGGARIVIHFPLVAVTGGREQETFDERAK